MYLDALSPVEASVGYGALGVAGDLGYEHGRVLVGGRAYAHALSTHAPARVRYVIDRRYRSFRCAVAINGDVPVGWGCADFFVYADGRLIASAPFVTAGAAPRALVADVAEGEVLELVVRTSRWNHAHAVWLDPRLERAAVRESSLEDCLGRAEIATRPMPYAERCVATVVSPGFEDLLDDMLGSLLANGGCGEARLVVLGVDTDAACEAVAAKYQATLVRCRPLAHVGMSVKAILYSVARIVDARQYLCLDADTLVAGRLWSVFEALDALPPGAILACRDCSRPGMRTVGDALRMLYDGGADDARVLGLTPDEAGYALVVNDGVFAGGREALLALDATIREMPQARPWIESTSWVWWRNQFVFNLALARLRAGVELDASYNVQLQASEATPDARVLHFNGNAKQKHPELRGRYARVARPLTGAQRGDGYAQFVAALRSWAGRHGLDALAWSFYGTADGASAQVADAGVFPLFAALHYLVRANGCVRVIEAGTARGISAACLASAVAHRERGRVVTLDPSPWPERQELWDALPGGMRSCIEARATGSLEGMRAAIEAGESFDAALLDSLHTEEHVWAELELARRLVCPGGLILVHDATWRGGTVEGALARMERAGYGVVRLWRAECGEREDDRLGLAILENRRRSDGRHA